MALRMELEIPPIHRLFAELREEVRDRFEDESSRQWERPRFNEPDLGTRDTGPPLATRGSSMDCPLPPLPWRLLLLSCPPGKPCG